MVVRVRAKYVYKGSKAPSALNSETDLVNLGAFSNDIVFEGYVDLSALQSGDSVTLKLYVAVDGANRRLLDAVDASGPLATPIVHVLSMTLPKDAQPRVTVTQTAGTLRTVYYWFVVQELEEL